MKMFKFVLACGLAISSAYLTGCASAQPVVSGFIYSDTQGPVAVTAAPKGNLHGKACATSYLGVIGTGDASISAAAKAANITQVSHVEQSSSSIMGLWAEYCTIVYGSRGIAPSAPMKVPTAQPAAPAAGGTGL